jgi:Tol biopolymer transport system component
MTVSVGDRLGRFEILGSLGAGGMGEVYRARDHQLKRDVAIKVLRAAFTSDADRRRRFEQEALAAGALNHPNIIAVYDVGMDAGSSYIVTEILEGETLQARMAGRALPPRKAADFALQIARGLAAAHDRGVVHRDIKPGNLFVTTDGRIKILDFGLAKLIGPESSGDTETVTIDGAHRTVLGTVAYLSPEVARGLRTDHRTDIFSFGVVFYEMLTGISPFRRLSTAETLNAILYDEAPELPRPDALSAALEPLVRRCLEKKPEERFQNFHDLAFDLDARAHDTGGVQAARRRARRGVGRAVAIAAVVAAAAVGALVGRQLAEPEPAVPHRMRVMTNFAGLEEFSSISPNGEMVAFTAARGGRRQIFVRFVNRGDAVQVTSDDADHQHPRWLTDGSSLLYFSPAGPGEVQGAIYTVPALGGAVQRVISSIGGADVSRDGRIACFRLQNERIELVTSTLEGADIRPIATLPTRHYRHPRWSPDGRRIAYQAGDGFRWDIHVVAADGATPAAPVTNESRFIAGLSWLPDGSGIVYASSRGATIPYLPPLALWEVRLDGRAAPRQLTPAEVSYEHPDVHASGLVSAARLQMRFDLWSYPFGTGGAPQPGIQVTHQTGQVLTPTASPDGDHVAYLSDSGGHANIWVASASRPPRQITFEDDPAVAIGLPIWSPDGTWIAFVSSRGNNAFAFGVWLVRPDGSELHQLVPKGLGLAWSADSTQIYFVEAAASPLQRIAVGGGTPVIVRAEPVRNVIGVHESMVYFLVERALMDGRPEFEIRAAPFGEGPARVVATIDAARVASWQVPFNPALSPDGKWFAMALTDGLTTNIWALSSEDGRWRQVTDFRDRAIFIARRVSWSADSRSVLAAIGEGDADIVLLDGLIKGRSR